MLDLQRTIRRGALLALLLGMWIAAPGVVSGSDRKLEMSLKADQDRRPFEYEALIPRKDADDFERGKNRTIQRYLLEAHKALAKKKGYRESIYGKEYWKIVRLEDWNWKILDTRSGRTESQGGRRGRVDSFSPGF